MRFSVVMVALFSFVGGSHPLAAAEPAAKSDSAVRLGDSSQGDVAYGSTEGGPWKVARRGETLPADVFLRTSAFGPCRVELAGGILQLGPESQVQLVATQRKVVVASGRAFLHLLAGWSVHAHTLKGTLAADTSCEFELGAGHFVTGRILAGRVAVTCEGREPVSVNAGQAFTVDPEAGKLSLGELPPADIERLHAATEPTRQPQGLGQLVVNDPQTGSPVRLNLARYHVNVVLDPPVALVQIDQSFYNPYPLQQEGTFVFNLPEGASVSRFAMYTSSPTDLIEGELIERAKAANIYQSIVSRQRDPAILEQIGGNLFRMRVFPIFPKDTKRILLDYTVPIVEQEEGRYSLRAAAHVRSGTGVGFFDRRNNSRPERGENRSQPVTSRGKVRCWRRASREVPFQGACLPARDRLSTRFPATADERSGSVRSFAVMAHRLVAETKDRANEDEVAPLNRPTECEFLATISPAALGADPKAPRSESPPSDVLILADTSGGMGDRTRLRQAVRTIAKSLRAQDRFQLGCVDAGFRPLTKAWVAPQTAAADVALASFDREFFLGETDFEAGLRGAVGALAKNDPGRRRLIVYIGDGGLRADQTLAGESQKRCVAALTETDARFCAALVDSNASGSGAMEKLTAATGGRLFRTAKPDSSEELFHWALAGCPSALRIAAIKAMGVAADDLFISTDWRPGRSLHIFGRKKDAGPLNLEVSFERDGKTESRSWTLNLKNDSDDVFVGRLWAQRKLDQLRSLSAAQQSELEQAETHRVDRRPFRKNGRSSRPTPPSSCSKTRLSIPNTESNGRLVINIGSLPTRSSRPLCPKRRLKRWCCQKRGFLRAQPPITRQQFEQALAAARAALDDRAPHRAFVFLESAAASPLAAISIEYKNLEGAARKLSAQNNLLLSLGPQRGWFERGAPIGFDRSPAQLLWQALDGYGMGGNYDEPYMAALAKVACLRRAKSPSKNSLIGSARHRGSMSSPTKQTPSKKT